MTEIGWTTLNAVLQAIGTVLIAGLLVMIIRWLGKQAHDLTANFQESTYAWAYDLIVVLVQAAEQRGLVDEALAYGHAKKYWVVQQAQLWLDNNNIKIDLHILDAMIEAAVYAALNPGRESVLPDARLQLLRTATRSELHEPFSGEDPSS